MKGVQVFNLHIVKDEERGKIFEFENRNSSKLLLVKRKKGTITGAHYHTGKSHMKNPETVVLLDGEAEFILKNVKTGEELIETFHNPVMFKLDPFIYHKINALTDIILIDMNSIEDDKDDTVRSDTLI